MSDFTPVQMPSRYKIVLILIVIDFVTKIGVFALLDHPIPSAWDPFLLHPATNKAGIAGFADIKWIEQESANIFGLAVSMALFSLVSLILSSLKLSSQQFRASIFLTGLVSVLLVKPLGTLVPHQNFSSIEILHICQISGALCLALAIYIAKGAIFTGCVVLLFSGSVGNQLGFLYPPYSPIDFLEIRQVGIFNLADLYIITGFFLLIIGILWSAVRGVYDLSEKLWSYTLQSLERLHKKNRRNKPCKINKKEPK